MTPSPEDQTPDVDPARRPLQPTSRMAASDAPRTSPSSDSLSESDEPPFDVDAPSPEVEPIYLRSRTAQATQVSQAAALEPSSESSPGSSSTSPSPQNEAATAAAATGASPSDPDALADVICRAMADALYDSMHAVVVAAIHSAEQGPVTQDPAQPAAVGKDDAPPPAIEDPAAGALRVRGASRATESRASQLTDAEADTQSEADI